MKAISASIIVLAGTLVLWASSVGSYSVGHLFNIGAGVVLAGLAGWVYSLRMEK
jgi:hypothetical protein